MTPVNYGETTWKIDYAIPIDYPNAEQYQHHYLPLAQAGEVLNKQRQNHHFQHKFHGMAFQ